MEPNYFAVAQSFDIGKETTIELLTGIRHATLQEAIDEYEELLAQGTIDFFWNTSFFISEYAYDEDNLSQCIGDFGWNGKRKRR